MSLLGLGVHVEWVSDLILFGDQTEIQTKDVLNQKQNQISSLMWICSLLWSHSLTTCGQARENQGPEKRRKTGMWLVKSELY